MASYPDALFVPRTVENRAGVAYDAAKTKVFYAEDLNDPNAEIVAIQETLGLNPEGTFTSVVDRLDDVDAQIAALDEDGGWRALATTPTRQSTDDPVFVLRFGADMTGILGLGMRIKIIQNSTVRYFIVVLVGAYTGGNTDVTVYGGTDYDVNDTSTYPISSPQYSREKAPFGFPLDPLKWTEEFYSTAGGSANPTNAWSNLFSQYLDVPVGCWDIDYQVSLIAEQNLVGGSQMNIGSALSNAVNSAAYPRLSAAYGFQPSANGTIRNDATLKAQATLSFVSKTRMYLNFIDETNTTSALYRGSITSCPSIIRARSVYL